jgi:hypothetical protein
MPEARDGDAAGKVDEFAIFLIPDPGTFADDRNHRPRRVIRHHDFIKQFSTDRLLIHQILSNVKHI